MGLPGWTFGDKKHMRLELCAVIQPGQLELQALWVCTKTLLLSSVCGTLQRIASTSSTVLAQDHFYSDFCCLPSTCQTQASSMAMICWQRQGEGVCTQQVDDNWGCHLLNGCLCAMLRLTCADAN